VSIDIKPENKGKLHEELGVKQGEKISTAKLNAAEKTAGPAERKRINFAKVARTWNHKGRSSGRGR
jgi:hypothetical protein